MATWFVDEGIAGLTKEWKIAHPGATVYTIGNSVHSKDPDISQHAPDDGKSSKPGDTKGEVDAADFMEGKGVTQIDLAELFSGLYRSRDKRIFYVIYRDQIFSSVTKPWVLRKHTGAYHSHVHVSVNDNYANDASDWKWEKLVARQIPEVKVEGITVPLLQYGDEDSADEGYNHIVRAQLLANWLEKANPLDTDGVYGAKTAMKFKSIFGGNGKTLSVANYRKLHGI